MTTSPADFREMHPGVFYLDRGDPAGLERYLRARGVMSVGERVVSVDRAGDGNMNCTMRVTTSLRSWIVKQARPWVEKYPQFAAPWDRALREAEFYQLVGTRPAVADWMPRLRAVDKQARVLVLEDFGPAADYTGVYRGAAFTGPELEQLAGYLSALHAPDDSPRGGGPGIPTPGRPSLSNREMRRLNHAHLFEIPLEPGRGPDLDSITPGLATAARRLQSDDALRAVVERLGREWYLADGGSLLHGDFFPGSILRTASGPRVIDPEFGFHGRPEFDVAVFLAHLFLANQSPRLASVFRQAYAAPGAFDDEAMWRLAGVEIVRRLIGYAQLPVGYGLSRKEELLDLARELILDPRKC